ncbi:MAG: CpaF family protein, partial [Acetobacteraceae bacterium]
VTEVCGMEGEVVILNDVFRLETTGERPDGRLAGRYVASRARPGFAERLAYFNLVEPWMAALAAAGQEP